MAGRSPNQKVSHFWMTREEGITTEGKYLVLSCVTSSPTQPQTLQIMSDEDIGRSNIIIRGRCCEVWWLVGYRLTTTARAPDISPRDGCFVHGGMFRDTRLPPPLAWPIPNICMYSVPRGVTKWMAMSSYQNLATPRQFFFWNNTANSEGWGIESWLVTSCRIIMCR